ncbi:MerR family transcriptional regulator [Yoonia sp. R2-816]|uniref:MerR family transcriptional regulator n=1 Tax=Yoonia sp. R2-816 TaxID=3342638 RepID=UPI003726540D
MDHRIREYTVGQLAKLSGVTVRTLHHYDAIGLLTPHHVTHSGYRVYGQAELLRLQEILFYRAFGLPLQDIAVVLHDEADALTRLRAHRERLVSQVADTQALLSTLDRTIATLSKEAKMPDIDLYTPFDAAKQTAYEDWLITTYGLQMATDIATSKAVVDAMPEGIAGAMSTLAEIEARLVTHFKAGIAPGDAGLRADLDAHRALMGQLWGKECAPEAYADLGELYLSHPDFVARYERLAERFSTWLPAAMQAYAAEISA